jgi:O-antigen ligase
LTLARSAALPLARAQAAHLVPAAAVVALFAGAVAKDGGYAPEDWLPGTIIVLALSLVSLASADVRRRLVRAPVAPLLLGLFAVWNYLSMLWAKVPADAWTGANRTLLYALVFALFVALPLDRTARFALVAAWAFAVAVIGLVDVLRAAAATGPDHYFILGRLSFPIAYANANAAVFGMAFLPLQVLASRRTAPAWLRVAAIGAATLVVELLVLGQSRGSVAAVALSVLLYLLLAKSLLRSLSFLVVTGVAVAAALPQLLHVYTAVVDGRGYSGALSAARAAIIVSTVAAAVAGAVAVALDERMHVSERTATLIRRVIVAAAAAGLTVALVAFLAFGHPVGRARTAWHDFTSNERPSVQTAHLESGVGTSRYDVYRIALHEFRVHPLLGDGSDNYLVPYLQQRRTGETSRYPSSVELRAFSETGIVGAVLFFGFLVAALLPAVRAVRREPAAGAALAALLVFAYWFLHASGDWLWEFPGLAAPALAFLALAGSPEVEETAPAAAARRPRGLAAAAVAAAVALGAATSLTLPWFSIRNVDQALAAGGASPAVYALLHDAARWNPLSDDPAVAEAAVAANAGDRIRERRALNDALKRNPHDWYLYLMLGVVDGRERRFAAAAANLARARRLSPLDQIVMYAQRRLAWGTPLTEAEVGKILNQQNRTMVGSAQS